MAYVPDDHKGFNPNLFLQTFSYREVLSAVMLALLTFAFLELILFFELEITTWIMVTLILAPPLLLHVIYRLEHKRSNSYLGRVLHDIVLVIALHVVFIPSAWFIRGQTVSWYDDIFVQFFVSLFIIFVLEGLFFLLKFLLDLLKWRIL